MIVNIEKNGKRFLKLVEAEDLDKIDGKIIEML